MSILLLVVGLALLVVGGDLLVRQASALAVRLGVSSLVIGLTVVAFGTSAPELAATLAASLRGVPELGVGNVLGSNVANIGFILGLTAAIAPIAGSRGFVRREIPVVLAVMVLLLPLAWNGLLGRVEGTVLLGLLVLYLLVMLRQDRTSLEEEAPDEDAAHAPLWRSGLGALAGIVALVAGAEALVRGATDIAATLGVPDRVIGLTMVAFGTSLPELASSFAAARRGEGGMVLGNIAGSNIFNILAVLGVTALVTPIPVDLDVVFGDLLIAIAFSAVLLPMMGLREGLGRKRGIALFLAYLLYVTTLFLQR